MSMLRPPIEAPPFLNEIPPRVRINHPFHNAGFIYLPACDIHNNQNVYHTETLLTACRIIANSVSAEDSYLSRSREPDVDRIAESTAVIPPGTYYFHVSTNPNYPIHVDFQTWKFPHGNLPESWAALPSLPWVKEDLPRSYRQMNSMVRMRDSRCLVTQWPDSFSLATLVPKEYREWFFANNMSDYAEYWSDGIYHPRNGLSLCHNIRIALWDECDFAFVPKEGRVRVHFLFEGRFYSIREYHNRPIDASNLSREYLYARFALAVMKHVKVWCLRIINPEPVLVYDEDGSIITLKALKKREKASRPPRKRRFSEEIDPCKWKAPDSDDSDQDWHDPFGPESSSDDNF